MRANMRTKMFCTIAVCKRAPVFLISIGAFCLGILLYAAEDSFVGLSIEEKNGMLFDAIYRQDNELIKKLIAQKADVTANDGNELKRQSLHWAACNQSVSIVELLLTSKASIDAKDEQGFEPIHYAVNKSTCQVVKTLLAGKASIDARNKKNNTPLHVAAQRGDKKIVQMLLEHKASLNTRADVDYDPLFAATWFNQSEIVRYLVECKATIDNVASNGSTLFHAAAEQGHVETMRFLLDQERVRLQPRHEYEKITLVATELSCMPLDILLIIVAYKGIEEDRKDAYNEQVTTTVDFWYPSVIHKNEEGATALCLAKKGLQACKESEGHKGQEEDIIKRQDNYQQCVTLLESQHDLLGKMLIDQAFAQIRVQKPQPQTFYITYRTVFENHVRNIKKVLRALLS